MTTPDKTTEATGQVLTVAAGTCRANGACNACTRYWVGNGFLEHAVLNIYLRQSTIRLCPNCARDLVALLQKHDPGRKARK